MVGRVWFPLFLFAHALSGVEGLKFTEVEIDRLLKRVNDGNSSVCDILAKLNGVSSNVQKDKLENDLKKEIKRLQRFREQIKTWLGSNEVKDKAILEDAKSAIEEVIYVIPRALFESYIEEKH